MSVTRGVTIDTTLLPAMLTLLRLPTIARLWQAITETANRESWPAAKTLAALFEHELAERAQRRTARHLLEARLPARRTIDQFDFAAAPSVSKARIIALAEGDTWLTKGTNILIFAPPDVGKSDDAGLAWLFWT
jgi:DNA replication protein DnaC